MNIPTKVIKTNSGLPPHTLAFHQNLAKNYFKLYKKKGGDLAEKDASFQNDVIKWFFSLNLISRKKICSLQNKWLATILQQMFYLNNYDNNVKFQLVTEETEELFHNILYTKSASFINVNVNSLACGDNSGVKYCSNYFNFYAPNYGGVSFSKSGRILENLEKEFLKEIKYISCDDQNDTITLGTKIINDEITFKKFFGLFSNEKFFKHFITPIYDPHNKLYNFSVPEWISNKGMFSMAQICASFFEQIILINYAIYKFSDQKKFILTYPYEEKLNQIIDESEKIAEFLKTCFPTSEDKKKMFEQINITTLSTEIRRDEKIVEMIKTRKKIQEWVFASYFNSSHYGTEKINITEALDECEIKLRTIFLFQSEEIFVDLLNYLSYDLIFGVEDFLFKKVFQEVHNLYTQKNALDLINEEKLNISGRQKSTGTSQKKNSSVYEQKKKKIKKGKKKRYVDEDQSSSPNTSTSDKIDTNTNNNTNTNTNSNPSIITTPHFNKVKDAMSQIVECVINEANKKIDQKEKQAIIEIDTDTTNSSSTISENNNFNKKEESKSKSKSKSKSNFFLYTLNPIHNKSNPDCAHKIVNEAKRKKIIDSPPNKQSIGVKQGKVYVSNPASPSSSGINTGFIYPKSSIISNQAKHKQENEVSPNEKVHGDNLREESNCRINLNLAPNNGSPTSSDKEAGESPSGKWAKGNSEKDVHITINVPVYNNYIIINSNNTTSTSPYIYQRKLSYSSTATEEHTKGNSSTTKPNATFSPFTTNSMNSYNINRKMLLHAPPQFHPHLYLSCFNPLNSFSPIIDPQYTYFESFHNEIVNYSKAVVNNIAAIKDIRIQAIKTVEQLVTQSLKEYDIEFIIYGSFANELSIESSDIDITVKFSKYQERKDSSDQINYNLNYNPRIEIIFNRLVTTFKAAKIFDYVNPIYTASVPVIKLQADIANICDDDNEDKTNTHKLKSSEIYTNYKFNTDEFDKVKIDLTFLENKFTRGESGYDSCLPSQQAVEYVKNSLICFPEIKPIIHVMKRYLQVEKLNSSFNGGLSSFSLFLLILAFFKYGKCSSNSNSSYQICLGRILVQLLEFYSTFNFGIFCVDVNSPNPFIFLNEIVEHIPLILDPITYLNVGKSSYRIQEIKSSFVKGLNHIFRSIYQQGNHDDILNGLFGLSNDQNKTLEMTKNIVA